MISCLLQFACLGHHGDMFLDGADYPAWPWGYLPIISILARHRIGREVQTVTALIQETRTMVLHVKRILGDPGMNGARALYDRGHRLHPAHDRGSTAAPLGSRLTYIHDGQTIEVGGGSLLWKECPNLYHIVPEVAPEMSCDCIRQKCEDFLETLQNTLQGNRLQDEFLIGLANPESLQKIFFSPWLHCPDVSAGGPSQNLLRSALVWLTIEGPTYIPGWEIAGGVGMSFPDVIELRHVNPHRHSQEHPL